MIDDEPVRVFPPSKYIKDLLDERGWTQADLAMVLGCPLHRVVYLMTTRKRMSPEFAQELGVVFGTTAEYWLGLDNAYRLSQTEYVDKAVVRRAAVYRYPIKEMQKRKWIAEVTETADLEDELKRFLQVESLEDDLPVQASYKRTIKESSLNKPERAWIARARQLANACPSSKFEESRLPNLIKELRRLAAKSKAVHRVPELLAKHGIRFVVVEPLPRVKIDGAAFWLDEQSPVIAMSIRFDNIGSFWFALFHELYHIKHKDAFSFDDFEDSSSDEAEVRANMEATETLVPQWHFETFIATSPRFSEARINNFATQLAIHPGIIVGQLHHRGKLPYSAHRTLTVKVRELATASAFTDGWGHPVPQV